MEGGFRAGVTVQLAARWRFAPMIAALQRDIRTPLEAMGHPPSRIMALGFGEAGALGGR